MSNSEVMEIDRFQRYVIKRIQGMSTRTRTDICESMLGLHPLSTAIIIRKLMFLHKLITLPSNFVSQLSS